MSLIEEGRTFIDRSDAGAVVGKLLAPAYKDKNVLVLGIPRGGVIVASQIARALNAELSVIITKKLPHPKQAELAIGAVAEDGSSFFTSEAREVDRETIQKIHLEQTREIASRVQRFRNGKPLPNMQNRVVIIADDGIATGSTILPAIKLCKSMKASRVVVAAPVSGRHYVREINSLADEVIIAEQPHMFYSVGQVYDDFHPLTDQEVITCLAHFRSGRG